MIQISEKWRVFLICTAIAVVTFIAFQQVRYNEFICFDDNLYITENIHVKEGITADSIVWAFTQSHAANWHPVTWLSHMLDCELFGTNPYWHHLNNLLLHIANSLLLFLVFKAMTGSIWPSAFTAFLFALHPLHVESVAWASERKDVLSTLFWFLTIMAYLRYIKKPDFIRYLPVFILFAIGLMAKPMLVTLPFVLLLLDYWPLGRMKQKNKTIQRLIIEKVPLLILALLSSIMTFIAQQKAMVPVEKLSLNLRINNAVVSYIQYIVKMIYPHKMAIPYPHPLSQIPPWLTIACFILLATISIIVICISKQHRYMATGWFWYIGTLVPVIGLIQVGAQSMADRYTYIPSIGIFILFTWTIREFTSKWKWQKTILSIAAIIILPILIICTRTQVKYWKNSFTLFEHTLKVTEKNYIAHNSYGALLCKEGYFEDGITHLRKSVEIYPKHTNALYNLGFALAHKGEYPEAILYLRRALKIDPDDPYIMISLAYVLITVDDTKLRNIKEAFALAQRACEITKYEKPEMLKVLEAVRKAADEH